MTQSLFTEYVTKWFGVIISQVTAKINGKEGERTYFYKTYLKPYETTDLSWASLESSGSVVAVDVVTMDSELPLKKRDSIKKASGTIPKMGSKMALNEKQLSDLNILKLKTDKEAAIVVQLFADAKKLVTGVAERLEYMFLEALSTGLTVVDDTNNVGAGIRVDFGVPAANKFGAAFLWSDATNSVPLDDIDRVMDAADANGHVLRYLFMDRNTINNFRKSDQVKQVYAFYVGFVGSTIPVPNLAKVNEMMLAEKGLTIIEVNKSVRTEKNGVQTSVKPWADGACTFTTTLDLGTVTYGELAEKSNPVAGVAYEVSDEYILVSKYRKNDPLQEFTSVQAMVLPVLQNTGAIYMLDSTDAQVIAPGEVEDANITLYGQVLVKATVITHYNTVTGTDIGSPTDQELINAINLLSDEDEDALKVLLGV